MQTPTEFPSYDAYIDSDVDWLGQTPKAWSIKPGMVAFTENKQSNKGMKEDKVLSLSYGNIIIKPKEKLVGLVPESFETYQLVEPSDIIIRCTDLQNDKVSLRTALAKDRGIITSAYLNLKVKEGFSPRFLHYYLHSIDTTKVIYKFGSGLRQNLSFHDFKRLPVFDIPKGTQEAIANFLDKKTAQIDKAIAIKEKQIELLKERKQIVIQKAVTQGLDTNIPMKDSGVDWIGRIPEHWELKKMKYIFETIQTGTTPTTSNPKYFDGDIDWYNPKDLNAGYLYKAEKTLSKLAIKQGEAKIFSGNSVLIVGIGATCGKTAYLKDASSFNQQITGFNSRYENSEFMYFLISTYSNVMLKVASYTTLPILNNEFFKHFWLPCPTKDEQDEIVTFLKRESEVAEKSIKMQQQQMDKLKEYKTTLINNAVTGKIKVL